MFTTLFLIIAFALRKRHLSENASSTEKFFYYCFCVIFTPLLGIPVFEAFMDSPADNRHDKEDSAAYPNMDLL